MPAGLFQYITPVPGGAAFTAIDTAISNVCDEATKDNGRMIAQYGFRYIAVFRHVSTARRAPAARPPARLTLFSGRTGHYDPGIRQHTQLRRKPPEFNAYARVCRHDTRAREIYNLQRNTRGRRDSYGHTKLIHNSPGV